MPRELSPQTHDVVRRVKAHRGPIYVGMFTESDIVYVQVVKDDFIKMVKQYDLGVHMTIKEEEGSLFVDTTS